MIEPASTLDMDDDTRGRMITRCVAYMTQRKIPIRDTRAVTRLLASPAAEFRPARILRLQHCGGTQIHARGPVESIATRRHRTSNPRIITCMT